MKVYHLKTCDTCKKALKALAGQEVSAVVDLRADGVDRATLERWLEAVGPDVLINRRSTTWRGLNEDERAGDPVDLLASHPTLIKRPVIEAEGEVHVGWTADVREALGLD